MRSTRFPGLALGVALLLLSGTSSFAQGSGSGGGSGGSFGFINQKSTIKKASRWTLEEWLATKERMKWSDLWLSFNSPSPYEFFLLGAYSLTPGNVRYGVGAYAQAVGLEYEQETTVDPAWNARFHLRIFGTNVQNTNFTLHAGIRGRVNPTAFRQGYAGASLTLYMRKFFGIYANYRYHFSSTPVSHGPVSGARFEGGPFIDFGPLRVFGYFLSESETGTSYSANVNYWSLGGQLFF